MLSGSCLKLQLYVLAQSMLENGAPKKQLILVIFYIFLTDNKSGPQLAKI